MVALVIHDDDDDDDDKNAGDVDDIFWAPLERRDAWSARTESSSQRPGRKQETESFHFHMPVKYFWS